MKCCKIVRHPSFKVELSLMSTLVQKASYSTFSLVQIWRWMAPPDIVFICWQVWPCNKQFTVPTSPVDGPTAMLVWDPFGICATLPSRDLGTQLHFFWFLMPVIDHQQVKTHHVSSTLQLQLWASGLVHSSFSSRRVDAPGQLGWLWYFQ